ncbi:MAG: efflux RND transporter permease subunit [Planctomycetota bacterium]|jgi:multidrug efflux pump subunit AcrB
MDLAKAAIKYRTITWMFTLIIFVGGWKSFQGLGRLEDPAFTIKNAVVITQYPGATPEEVEEEVTERVENAVQQLGELKEVTSVSRAGLSIVEAEMKDRYGPESLPQIWDKLRRKVGDMQRDLPPGAGPSLVNDDFGDVYGIYFAITGEGYTYQELQDYIDDLRRELLLVNNVAKVVLYGAKRECVYVEMSRARMAELGLSPKAIFNTLQQQNVVVPSGSVQVGSEHLAILPTGDQQSIAELGNLLITGSRGEGMVRLRDVATVQHGYIEPASSLMRHNGQEAIGLGISIAPGGNVVELGKGIRAKLAELEPQRPLGIELNTISFEGETVDAAVSGFVINLIEAIVIVVVVLLIFMGMKSGLLIGLILFLTVLATFLPMAIYDINLQRISLGALIIALGMLVDNAIVVVEGVLVGVQRGKSPYEAASEIVKQTVMPLLGATFVAIMAFSGIGLSPDATGEYCGSLFQVIAISLLLSWVLAVTVTPLFCTYVFNESDANTDEGEDPYGSPVFQVYKRFLELCLQRRKVVVVALAGLMAAAVIGFGFVDQSFFPDSTRPQFYIDFWNPEGTHIDSTIESLAPLEEHIQGIKGVSGVTTMVGQGALRFILTYTAEKTNSSYAQLLVTVEDYGEVDRIIGEVKDHMAGQYPDVQPMFKKFVLGPGGGAKIETRFIGPDPAVLRRLSEQAKEVFHASGNATEIRDDWRERVKQVRPVFSESSARRAGITRKDLRDTLQMNFNGQAVGLYREDDKLLPILARPPEREREGVDNIQDLQVWSPVQNSYVPIRQVVGGFRTEWTDNIVRRKDRRRTITAMCDPATGYASALFKRIRPQIEAIELPPGYTQEWGGEFENSSEAQASLFKLLPLSFLAMVVVVIALFNAVKQPAVIWLCVPMAIIGVTAGLLICGRPFGFMALLGILSLSGMLIKNAVVLIDQFDLEIREGKDPYLAIVDSSLSRIRPVSMAAVTTILGMLPLIFDAFFVDMAVTIMFGLAFATGLTLVAVPVLYAIFFGARK